MNQEYPVKVLRIFAEGPSGIVTVVQSAKGSWNVATQDGQTLVLEPTGPCVILQADMVSLTRPDEVKTLSLWLRNAADWLKEQQNGK